MPSAPRSLRPRDRPPVPAGRDRAAATAASLARLARLRDRLGRFGTNASQAVDRAELALRARIPSHGRLGGLITSPRFRRVAPYLVLAIAWAFWAQGVATIALGQMNDFGLISVLPVQVLFGILLLTAGAIGLLRAERPNVAALTVYLVSLVFFLYAIPAVVEQVAHFSVNWVHAGFIEYIRRTGAVAPQLEARFDWPGFFILAAFLSEAAGIANPVDFANWAPVYFNLAYLLALAMLFRACTRDQRLVWAALWLFALGNWIGQDYFAPQALAYFLDLVILGIVLTWFRVARPRSERVAAWLAGRTRRAGRWAAGIYGLATPNDEEPRRADGAQLTALVALLAGIFAFIAYSHQLTPFFLSAALLALVAFNRLSARSLPFMFGVMTVAWVSYMTVPFLQGHVASLLSEVGRLGDTVGSNVTQRITGSPTHELIVRIRLLFTVAVWGVAALGVIVRFRDGRRDLSLVILAVAPFPLAALQTYGGEVVLRLYLFSLPMAAFFAAGLLYGRPGPSPSRLRQLLAVGASVALVAMFFVTRYGNERADLMTSAEVQAVQRLYAMAPKGSLLVAASNNLPWKFQDFESYTYLPDTDGSYAGKVDTIATVMSDSRYPAAYLILTRSEEAYAETFTGFSSSAWATFVAQVRASPRFVEVYSNADAEIFTLAGPPLADATATAHTTTLAEATALTHAAALAPR